MSHFDTTSGLMNTIKMAKFLGIYTTKLMYKSNSTHTHTHTYALLLSHTVFI